MNKKISYLARSFDDIKSELLNFSKKYYPELSDNFNDASVGAWMLDMVSAVGDDLAYHTDRMYQETNINSANSRSSILNNARMNGIKIPGAKSSLCEVELSCTVGVKDNSPKVDELPVLKMGGTVGNSSYTFELTEDVNFAEQFNKDGFSNRKIVPTRDNNGIITGYTVTKNTIVVGGQSKIYKNISNIRIIIYKFRNKFLSKSSIDIVIYRAKSYLINSSNSLTKVSNLLVTAKKVFGSSKSTPASLASTVGYLLPPAFNKPLYLSKATLPSFLTFS